MPRLGLLMMQNAGVPRVAYLQLSIVRWLEAAGITVVPIPPNIGVAEAAAYFEYVQGLFLHPGWADQPAYAALVRMFLTMAVEENKKGGYFPVWGTCQGFQRLIQFFGSSLDNLKSLRFATGTRFILQTERRDSRILRYASDAQFAHLKHDYVPWFNHEYGISLRTFRASKRLGTTFRVLSTSHDRAGTEYVSMIEGKTLPFYGVQFHPDQEPASLGWMAEFLASELAKSRHGGFHPRPTLQLTDGECEEEGHVMQCLRLEL